MIDVTFPAGLDRVLEPYIPQFVRAGVKGQQLLNLTNMDLKKLGMVKVGHQEMLLEAVSLIYAIVRISHNNLCSFTRYPA